MKRVLIVGGGFAGSIVARKLEKKFEVTFIDTKPYFEFTPGILRTIAHPQKSRCMQVMHKNYLKQTNIIVGSVREITNKYVIVNSKKIKFDYLVLCTGSSYKAPFKHPQMFTASRTKELSKYNEKIKNANNVLVIGGGLVGVELAGELAHYFPEKNINIVNFSSELLERMPQKARDYAKNYLENKKVQIISGELIKEHSKNMFITNKNKKIKADVAFACTGITPNSSFLTKNFKSKINNKGFVEVDKHLRLKDSKNIFVAGDLTAITEEKTAQNAERHAELIVQNIINIENNTDLIEYKTKKTPIVISLGPYNGIFVFNDFVLTGIIPAFLKWFVEKKEILRKRI